MRCPRSLVAIAVALLFVAVPSANAKTLFFENVEHGLGRWGGPNGGLTTGRAVSDPIRPHNHVLAFHDLSSGGDIFSPSIPVSRNSTYVLSFDFLGKPGEGGGIVGISLGTPYYHRWLVGTRQKGLGETNPLVDDGKWHHYSVRVVPGGRKWFTPDGVSAVDVPSIPSIHIMIEQNWGVPGTAYFDNIALRAPTRNRH